MLYLFIFLGTILVFLVVYFVFCIFAKKAMDTLYQQIQENEPKVQEQLKNDGFVITSTVDAEIPIAQHKGLKTERFWAPSMRLYVDSQNKRIAIGGYIGGASVKYFNYNEIAGYDIVQSGESIKSTTLASGYTTSTGGAIGVGTTTSTQYIDNLQLVIYSTNIDQPTYTLQLVEGRLDTTTPGYKKMLEFAQGVKAVLTNILKENGINE